jgi:16S rRNA processing protein RimM
VARNSARRIVLGHVTGAHGIRGDVTVRSHTADPADLDAYGPLSDEEGLSPLTITRLRPGPKGTVVHFADVEDRSAAEALRGRALCVERSALPPAEDGAFYHVDLIGLDALTPSGEPIGQIVAVENFGAGDLLEIKLIATGETEYVPFTDACVPSVDLAAGRAVVVMPETTEAQEQDAPKADTPD